MKLTYRRSNIRIYFLDDAFQRLAVSYSPLGVNSDSWPEEAMAVEQIWIFNCAKANQRSASYVRTLYPVMIVIDACFSCLIVLMFTAYHHEMVMVFFLTQIIMFASRIVRKNVILEQASRLFPFNQFFRFNVVQCR